ncbi:MAG: hypothetical protein AB1813_18605 [Verrucomicrobiota bacterium]
MMVGMCVVMFASCSGPQKLEVHHDHCQIQVYLGQPVSFFETQARAQVQYVQSQLDIWRRLESHHADEAIKAMIQRFEAEKSCLKIDEYWAFSMIQPVYLEQSTPRRFIGLLRLADRFDALVLMEGNEQFDSLKAAESFRFVASMLKSKIERAEDGLPRVHTPLITADGEFTVRELKSKFANLPMLRQR